MSLRDGAEWRFYSPEMHYSARMPWRSPLLNAQLNNTICRGRGTGEQREHFRGLWGGTDNLNPIRRIQVPTHHVGSRLSRLSKPQWRNATSGWFFYSL